MGIQLVSLDVHTGLALHHMLLTIHFPTDTSDEEFVQDATAGDISDVCSDLDEEEGENGVEPVGEAMEEDQSNSPETSDNEDEEVGRPLLTKKKPVSSRRLDSDDEEDTEVDETLAEKDVAEAEGECLVATVEGSMPPLRLDSVEDEESLLPASQSIPGHLTADSGIGHSLLHQREDSSGEESEGEEGLGKNGLGNEEEGSMSVTDGDSLELSFQWGQSLPLAQPTSESEPSRRRPSLHRDDTINIWEEESQWQATPTADATQSQFLDEGTRFLDEDG